MDNLRGSVNTKTRVVGTIQIGSVIRHENEYYDGEYDITPSAGPQVLPVKDKAMSKDITIEAIPYHEVSNQANGITVTIGE